jgi:hypothetical protein
MTGFCLAAYSRQLAIVGSCTIAVLAATGPGRAAADVVVPGTTDFPESMHASADGTLYFSSLAAVGSGARPGETQASEWIKRSSRARTAWIRPSTCWRTTSQTRSNCARTTFQQPYRHADRRHSNGTKAV